MTSIIPGLLIVIPSLFGTAQAEPSNRSVIRCDEKPLSQGTTDYIKTEARTAFNKRNVGATEKRKNVSASINGQKVNINYTRYKGRKSPIKGVIISLCGGPGFSCTDAGRGEHFPEDYDVVQFDYMGIGKNNRYNSPEMMSIDSQGEAAAAIAKSLGKENIVIFGQSFGTAVATAAASKLTQGKSPLKNLKGVVLEGTIGKAGGSTKKNAHVIAADAVWKAMKDHGRNKFKSDYQEITKDMSITEKTYLDYKLVSFLASGIYVAIDQIKEFIEENKKEKNKQYFAASYGEQDGILIKEDESNQQYRAAGCQISGPAGDMKPATIFDGLVNVTAGTNNVEDCKCRTVARDYEPNEYQIKNIPVLYLNGEFDPLTPVYWAETHFDGQKQVSEKLFIEIPMGGHYDSQGYGPITSCSDTIYNSMFKSKISDLQVQVRKISQGDCSTRSSSRSVRGVK